MNLRQLEYFLTLAETEHMTKAAKELKTSQPNISHAMSSLEQELGVPLFQKDGRNIRLTRYGRIFYSYVSPSIQEINKGQKLLQAMAEPTSSELHFGFIYTVGAKLAPKITRDFQNLNQDRHIHFEFYQGTSNHITELLRNDVIDVGICSKINDAADIQYSVFYKEELVLVVPEDHVLAHLDEIYLNDAMKFPFVYFTKQSGLRSYLDETFRDMDLQPKIAYELDEDHSVLGFVGNDFGIAIIPNIPSISSYPVKKIKIIDRLPDRNLYLALKKNKVQLPIVKDFWDFCRNQFETD